MTDGARDIGRRVFLVLAGSSAGLLSGCVAPIYTWDSHTASTALPSSFDVADLGEQPVATLGLITPGGLEGLGAALSHALTAALAGASPAVRATPAHETLNALNQYGLAAQYAELLSGFDRTRILERERLQRIGSALGVRYALLPGLAQLEQTLVDKFELAGIKLVRNRVIALRLWLQLWDTRIGRIVWQSAGEVTATSTLASPSQTVPLDELAQRLWFRMIKDDLLDAKAGPPPRPQPPAR